MNVEMRLAKLPDDIQRCLRIREAVFIDEQHVPADLERDGMDDVCLHYIAEAGGNEVATARVMLIEGKFKFQRVAVMPEARGLGVGSRLMAFMMSDLEKRDDASGREFFLSSQNSAIRFYERMGFEVCSEEYLDAGIKHRDMRKRI